MNSSRNSRISSCNFNKNNNNNVVIINTDNNNNNNNNNNNIIPLKNMEPIVLP